MACIPITIRGTHPWARGGSARRRSSSLNPRIATTLFRDVAPTTYCTARYTERGREERDQRIVGCTIDGRRGESHSNPADRVTDDRVRPSTRLDANADANFIARSGDCAHSQGNVGVRDHDAAGSSAGERRASSNRGVRREKIRVVHPSYTRYDMVTRHDELAISHSCWTFDHEPLMGYPLRCRT